VTLGPVRSYELLNRESAFKVEVFLRLVDNLLHIGLERLRYRRLDGVLRRQSLACAVDCDVVPRRVAPVLVTSVLGDGLLDAYLIERCNHDLLFVMAVHVARHVIVDLRLARLRIGVHLGRVDLSVLASATERLVILPALLPNNSVGNDAEFVIALLQLEEIGTSRFGLIVLGEK